MISVKSYQPQYTPDSKTTVAVLPPAQPQRLHALLGVLESITTRSKNAHSNSRNLASISPQSALPENTTISITTRSMATRRAHRKSRLGCQTCKRRKVKCDEIRPRCGPCVLRDIECSYLTNKTKPADYETPFSSAKLTTDDWPSDSSTSLELELMHQWTSTTYKSYCASMTEEYENWQILIPRLALQHDFLLHALFAMSALEIVALSDSSDEAAKSHSKVYLNAALQYQGRVSHSLRNEIMTSDFSSMPVEKHRALWATSSILMVLALALPRYNTNPIHDDDGDEEEEDVLSHMLTYYELMKGFILIVYSRMASTTDDPLLSNFTPWDDLPHRPLEPPELKALTRLKEINERTFGASRTNTPLIPELEALNYHALYRKAIFFLEQTFQKCMYPKTRGYGLAWLFQGGPGLVEAIRAREPFALLLLAHWALWMESSSYGIWYVEGVGRRLVDEVSGRIEGGGDEEVGVCLRWVRGQVGLEGGG